MAMNISMCYVHGLICTYVARSSLWFLHFDDMRKLNPLHDPTVQKYADDSSHVSMQHYRHYVNIVVVMLSQ